MQNIFEFVRAEWKVLKKAPFSFIGLAVICAAIGFGVAAWHYSERISTIEAQAVSKDDLIHRYKVALGVEAASKGNLVELTNEELAIRAINTSAKLRNVCLTLRSKDEAAAKTESKLGDIEKFDRAMARMRAAGDQIDRTVRSDTILVDHELRRRLDPRAVSAIAGLPPSVYDAVSGTPIDIASLATTGGTGMSFYLCVLADGIEQMAKLLPKDSKKP